MFKTNLQIHKFKEVLEVLQHIYFFSPVFAFFSFLNKDRLGIEISYCFETINTFSEMAKEFNLMNTRFTKTDLELLNLLF